jgi:hypothetical protein
LGAYEGVSVVTLAAFLGSAEPKGAPKRRR